MKSFICLNVVFLDRSLAGYLIFGYHFSVFLPYDVIYKFARFVNVLIVNMRMYI